MPLQPVPFDDYSGGLTDKYVGTDTKFAARLDNFLIDETKKIAVRYGTSIFSSRLPFAANSIKPSNIYVGAAPYSHPIVTVGPHAYIANELGGWTEITGPNTTYYPTKTDSTRDASVLWRRQLISCAPVTSLPACMAYCTRFTQPANTSLPATYKALTLGMPALASAPTITGTGTGYTFIYAFFYKYTFVDYTGTVFAFFGNPNLPQTYSVSNNNDPATTNIAHTAIPALANSSLTNYDVSSLATTNTTFVSGSTSATVVSATGIVLGAQVICANVPLGTLVTAIVGTTITLSQAATISSTVSTTFSTLTIQIYRTINGGTSLLLAGQVANGTTTFTDNVSDATLQTRSSIYTAGNALGFDQPPTGALAVTQTNDFFWWATQNNLYQSIQGAPGACPTSFQNQVDQKVIGLANIVSFPVLYCDRGVYRVEGTFDSYGNNGFLYRTISETAGCVSNASIVKTPYGLFWWGNGGIFWTDGYQCQKISTHLNTSYAVWASSKVVGAYDPNLNTVNWAFSTFGTGNNNAFLVLHLNYPVMPQGVFSTLSSQANFYPTALAYTASQDLLTSDPSVTTNATVVSGNSVVTVSSATGIVLGQSVKGIGIPYGAIVTLISGTSVTLSKTPNQSGVFSLTFSQIVFSQFYSRMLFTDVNAYLLWFDPSSTADVLIDTTKYPVSMAKKTIMYDYTTAGLDQGVKGFRKYNTDFAVEIDAYTAVAMQVRHRRDDGGSWSGTGGSPTTGATGSPGGGTSGKPGTPELRADGPIIWNITDCSWLNDANEHPWDDFATITDKRSIPSGQLRSALRQLKFTNSYTNIANSDTLGTATIAVGVPSAKKLPTVTLNNYPTKTWITDPEGYYITFVVDNYVQSYQIVNRVSDQVLQVTDPYNTLVAGSTKWVIKGFRKFERPRLLSFSLFAEVEGPTYAPSTSPAGANS